MYRRKVYFFFSSRRRHTRCALVTGVQTCALPIYVVMGGAGSAVAELLNESGVVLPILHLGLPDAFQHHASREDLLAEAGLDDAGIRAALRSEEHTSELQSLMRISYAVFCLNKKTKHTS